MRSSRMERVVVTGTSGRIGGAVRLCLAEHYDVVGLDRVPSMLRDVVADVADADAVRRRSLGQRRQQASEASS